MGRPVCGQRRSADRPWPLVPLQHLGQNWLLMCWPCMAMPGEDPAHCTPTVFSASLPAASSYFCLRVGRQGPPSGCTPYISMVMLKVTWPVPMSLNMIYICLCQDPLFWCPGGIVKRLGACPSYMLPTWRSYRSICLLPVHHHSMVSVTGSLLRSRFLADLALKLLILSRKEHRQFCWCHLLG